MPELSTVTDDFLALQEEQPDLQPESALLCDSCGETFPAGKVRMFENLAACSVTCYNRLETADEELDD